jgi:hypothetical protein
LFSGKSKGEERREEERESRERKMGEESREGKREGENLERIERGKERDWIEIESRERETEAARNFFLASELLDLKLQCLRLFVCYFFLGLLLWVLER